MESKNAVVTMCNTTSGLFKWWDHFPQKITKLLLDANIDHLCFYKSYSEDSAFDHSDRNEIDYSVSSLFKLYKKLKPYNKVIIHTHSCYPPVQFVIFQFIVKKITWIKTEHRLGSQSSPLYKRMLRRVFCKFGLGPSQVISVSNAVKKRVEYLYGTESKTIHNGIKLPISLSAPKQVCNISNGLYVGRLAPSKGIWNLLYAYNILINDKQLRELTLTVVGGGQLYSKLKEYVVNNGLENNIFLVGYKHSPDEYYKKADFQIIPTVILEACPLVSLEARSESLPILYSNFGGLPETVEKGGVPLIGNSPEKIAMTIERFCSDIENYKKIQTSSSKNLRYFSIERMVGEYVSVYKGMF